MTGNRKRVPLYGRTGSVTVEEGATKGATFGVDLVDRNGTPITVAMLAAAVGQAIQNPNPPPFRVIWERVEQKPSNIRALAATTGTGLFAITGDATGAFRTIQPVAGETTVDDGDGVAEDPRIGLADLPDSEEGLALVKITRDDKGRVSGTEEALLADLANVAADAPADDNLLAWDALTEAWTPRARVLDIVTVPDAAYLLLADDAGTNRLLRFTDADAQITVQAEATEPMQQGSVITGRIVGAAADLIEDTGVTINLPAGGSLALVQGNRFELVRVAADEWDLTVN